LDEVAAQYRADADALLKAIREHCWDERDGFYYSVDLNLTTPDCGSGPRIPGSRGTGRA